jgi:tetratricopeptide (TPR) repeat protein
MTTYTAHAQRQRYMMKFVAVVPLLFALGSIGFSQDQPHEHPAPEKLGKVSFPTSCASEVQAKFERAVALLHSFSYSAADAAFRDVASADPHCPIAYWGQAMTNFHQLWDTPAGAAVQRGNAAVKLAQQMGTASEREREFIAAIALIFAAADSIPYRERAVKYEAAMHSLAARYPSDNEAQIFYALSLLATARPEDTSHANQKKAVAILEPLFQKLPEHPGVAHYLIHAYDNPELAKRGVPAAREYSKIAPSAPHALHMPSHIFTRLGMWTDSIQSNLAARAAAHQQGDTGEELHAMDYLEYAYLQMGLYAEAAGVLHQLQDMSMLNPKDFKIGYAATAMPVRYAVERRQWIEAAKSTSPEGAPPHVAAIATWSRVLGFARTGNAAAAKAEIGALASSENHLRAEGNGYWAGQVHILMLEASAWTALAEDKTEDSTALMRSAADEEDRVEKLPVTPGPIVPAREQLGDLLLQLGRPEEALKEYEATLSLAPGRRNALDGARQSAQRSGAISKAQQYELALQKANQ